METLAKRLSPLLGVEAESASDKKGSQPSSKRRWILGGAVLALAAITAGWFYFSAAPEPTAAVPDTKTQAAAPAASRSPSPALKTLAVRIPLERRPLAITMIHDSGKPRNYTAVYVLGDVLHYGPGFNRSSLLGLLKHYASSPNARFAAPVTEYLPRLEADDNTLASDRGFRDLLVRAAGEDPVMTQLQDQWIQDGYFEPARQECAKIGITSALGYALIADTHFQGSYQRIRQATTQALDGTPITGIDEHEWLREFAKQRVAVISQLRIPDELRDSVLEKTRLRTETYTKLMDMNKWDLSAPVPVDRFMLIDP
jgi:Glycosyl hydrolase family 46